MHKYDPVLSKVSSKFQQQQASGKRYHTLHPEAASRGSFLNDISEKP
jgi:hypothetical protein